MRTFMVDILDDKAVNLLKDLEDLKIIKLYDSAVDDELSAINRIKSYKGKMAKQSTEEIEQQLNDLRNEWE